MLGRGFLKPLSEASVTDVRPCNSFNPYEVNVLKDYLTDKGQTVQQMWEFCVEKLVAGEYSYAPPGRPPVTADTVMCTHCVIGVVSHLALQYRREEVDSEDLPAIVRDRPNCWYGTSCRTQMHNTTHCRTRNHICAQTRF